MGCAIVNDHRYRDFHSSLEPGLAKIPGGQSQNSTFLFDGIAVILYVVQLRKNPFAGTVWRIDNKAQTGRIGRGGKRTRRPDPAGKPVKSFND
jgi:hypothetical protein